MKLHRFFVPGLTLSEEVTIDDPAVLKQWSKVLRFQPGRQVALFNDRQHEKLYSLQSITRDAAVLLFESESEERIPQTDLYLCFSLLKKDKNDWVLQKCTELGVRHFVPVISQRTEKTGFDIERAQKIVIEAAEQCGRVDIPTITEPEAIHTALEHLPDNVTIYVAEQDSPHLLTSSPHIPLAVLIGPEGGWADTEKQYFEENGVEYLRLGEFTLRAETASMVATTKLMVQ